MNTAPAPLRAEDQVGYGRDHIGFAAQDLDQIITSVHVHIDHELCINEQILEGVAQLGNNAHTPLQAEAIPAVLA